MMLYIRNMESNRCKAMVRGELDKLGLPYKTVELGEVELKGDVSKEKLQTIDRVLRNAGLELMDDKKSLLVEKIKEAINQLIFLSDNLPQPNFSDYISRKVNRDYNSLSSFFSHAEGTTIEKYVIEQKIGRVKELLVYEKLSISDIAYKLHYSSVAHLSNQFKKTTGLTPSFFRQNRSTGYRKSGNRYESYKPV